MSSSTKAGLKILQIALALGILGDVLLRATPWGLNVLLFNLAFAGGMIFLLKRHAPGQLTAQAWSLFGAQIFFAAMFVWRDAIELRVADTVAIITILSVLFVPRMNVSARFAGVAHYAAAFVWSSFNAITAPFLLIFGDVQWAAVPREGWRKHAFGVVRGLAIAAPLILVFGALFVAADAAYEGLVQRAFNFEPDVIFSHILIFSAFTWLSAGYLRGILIRPIIPGQPSPPSVTETEAATGESKVDRVRAETGEYPVTLPGDRSVVEHLNIDDGAETEAKADASATANEPRPNTPKPWNWANIDNSVLSPVFTLGSVEIGVVLGLMNLLFLSFVIVQVPYLFGGMELVQNTPDFKLAEYARRGFGELVAVSALVLPMLLAAHWLIRKNDRFAGTLFRILAGTQIILLFVIMASAIQRLVLLTGPLGYGMTTVRLYPLIFMSWLAVVFVWFSGTVLRGLRQYFAWGALWSAIFFLGATHFLNPDAFIVRTNLALMQQGRDFDAHYNSKLSDDAIPVLIEAMPQMSLEDRCEVGSAIHYRYRELGRSFDIRSYNFSRRTAWRTLYQNDGLLHQTEGCPAQYSNDQPGASPN